MSNETPLTDQQLHQYANRLDDIHYQASDVADNFAVAERLLDDLDYAEQQTLLATFINLLAQTGHDLSSIAEDVRDTAEELHPVDRRERDANE